jgi:hypothetical protein
MDASTKSISVGNCPLIGRAFTYRAEAEYHLGLYEEAISDASTATCMNGSDSRAYKIRAKCYEHLGRKTDAEADLLLADQAKNGRDL